MCVLYLCIVNIQPYSVCLNVHVLLVDSIINVLCLFCHKMYLLYIKRASDLFGATRTRSIYEKAIKSLPDTALLSICLRYARLELLLGEVDRARGIFTYGSQFADSQVHT